MNINKIDDLATNLELATNATVQILKSNNDTEVVPVLGVVPTLKFRVNQEIQAKFGDLNKRLTNAVETSESNNKTAQSQINEITKQTDAVKNAAQQVQDDINNGKTLLNNIKTSGESSVTAINVVAQQAETEIKQLSSDVSNDIKSLNEQSHKNADVAQQSASAAQQSQSTIEQLADAINDKAEEINQSSLLVASDSKKVADALAIIDVDQRDIDNVKSTVMEIKAQTSQLAANAMQSSVAAKEALDNSKTVLTSINATAKDATQSIKSTSDSATRDIKTITSTSKKSISELVDQGTVIATATANNAESCKSSIDTLNAINNDVQSAKQSVNNAVDIAVCGLATDLLKTHEYIITH